MKKSFIDSSLCMPCIGVCFAIAGISSTIASSMTNNTIKEVFRWFGFVMCIIAFIFTILSITLKGNCNKRG